MISETGDADAAIIASQLISQQKAKRAKKLDLSIEGVIERRSWLHIWWRGGCVGQPRSVAAVRTRQTDPLPSSDMNARSPFLIDMKNKWKSIV